MEEQIIINKHLHDPRIVLKKMSKGYNWEIEVYVLEQSNEGDDIAIDRLEKIDKQLRKKYGDVAEEIKKEEDKKK